MQAATNALKHDAARPDAGRRQAHGADGLHAGQVPIELPSDFIQACEYNIALHDDILANGGPGWFLEVVKGLYAEFKSYVPREEWSTYPQWLLERLTPPHWPEPRTWASLVRTMTRERDRPRARWVSERARRRDPHLGGTDE
ncbi:MAG: hypothetical protein JWN04_620 [Myxococcaceae bacterium]|nr:hypothetical protein [Myxococcaceae bacterium]